MARRLAVNEATIRRVLRQMGLQRRSQPAAALPFADADVAPADPAATLDVAAAETAAAEPITTLARESSAVMDTIPDAIVIMPTSPSAPTAPTVSAPVGQVPVPAFTINHAMSVDIITYRKGKRQQLPHARFTAQRVSADGQEKTYWLYDQSRVRVGRLRPHRRRGGVGPEYLWLRPITVLRDDGRQTVIVTNRSDLSAVQVVVAMFRRWRQENYFKYMDAEFALRNRDADSRHDHIMRVTSLPLDPLAEDFGERINVIDSIVGAERNHERDGVAHHAQSPAPWTTQQGAARRVVFQCAYGIRESI